VRLAAPLDEVALARDCPHQPAFSPRCPDHGAEAALGGRAERPQRTEGVGGSTRCDGVIPRAGCPPARAYVALPAEVGSAVKVVTTIGQG
jgi:hypothetical protein